MESNKKALYESAPTKKSMGNTYSIYPDRIEWECPFPFVTQPFVVKKEDLISIAIYQPPVIRTTCRALKLDLADVKEHVGIKRNNGFFKQLRFTPENPKEFVSMVKEVFNLSC